MSQPVSNGCGRCPLFARSYAFSVGGLRALALKPTLECGQAFRWLKMSGGSGGSGGSDGSAGSRVLGGSEGSEGPEGSEASRAAKSGARSCYVGVVKGARVVVSESVDQSAAGVGAEPGTGPCVTLEFRVCGCADEDQARLLVSDYFDLASDHEEVERRLSALDPVMATAVGFGRGLRILRQDPWECVVSYIVSSVNRVERIACCVERMCGACAPRPADGVPCFTPFPDAERLCALSVEDMIACGLGFRARYVRAAAEAVASGAVDLRGLAGLDTRTARSRLLGLAGVGPKVADCVLLFGYGRREAFPNDVWIGRAVSRLYFGDRSLTAREVQSFAESHFGDLAGYAQEYLYYYARRTGLRSVRGKESSVKAGAQAS